MNDANKMKYEKEFREACPETIGEKDQTFDQHNYSEWLESELQHLREENKLICNGYTIKNHPDLPNGSKVVWIENEQGEGTTVDIDKLFSDSF